MNKPQISFVVPLFNESKSFPLLIERLNSLMTATSTTIEVVLIDDGSKDNTAQLMQQLALNDTRYQCIFLSRNYGHQIALSAGLSCANATEAVMVIDGDLQDPPELFSEFYEQYKKGYDVVYAIRKKRKEFILKKAAYFLFYRMLKKISYIDIPLDSGDFSLISKRVVDILNKMPEESRYIRGMRSWVGFNQIGIEYERAERAQDKSKYSISMLFKLAFNGIFNFSELPIRFITRMGLVAISLALVYLAITIIKKMVLGTVPEGFTALLFAIVLFSGVQLISLGVIGEYVLRIFHQVKKRPLFIIKDKIVNKEFVSEKTIE
jgi:glycosyltransferase involved in cell wall biosynthesis